MLKPYESSGMFTTNHSTGASDFAGPSTVIITVLMSSDFPIIHRAATPEGEKPSPPREWLPDPETMLEMAAAKMW